jgi:hypothetical protein
MFDIANVLVPLAIGGVETVVDGIGHGVKKVGKMGIKAIKNKKSNKCIKY